MADSNSNNDIVEPGFLHIAEKEDTPAPHEKVVLSVQTKPLTSIGWTGTIEHLAARRPTPEIDPTIPEVKERLSELRTEFTRTVTGVRWKGLSVEDAAAHLLPLLNIGPVQQWKSVLIPQLFEIDRAGDLLPVWFTIIEKEDSAPLAAEANPAETMAGRAKRYAIIMLGKYKSQASNDKELLFARAEETSKNSSFSHAISMLGGLAVDPDTSLYATQSLAQIGTMDAIHALVNALKDAEGWAKVDVVENILTLNLPQFYELLLTSGLDRVPGLENYVAIPLYRALPLERYLREDDDSSPLLSQQAAIIFGQILQEGMTPPDTDAKTLPVVFERDLPPLAHILFDKARSAPTWQYVLAVHRLAMFMGRYWSAISGGTLQDQRIVEPIYLCLLMMGEIERWMEGPGRDVLLDAVTSLENEPPIQVIKILGELREPRAIAPLLTHLEAIRMLTDRNQALTVGAMCDTLALLKDRRAIDPMLHMLDRIVDIERRISHPKRSNSLPLGDGDVPGSIVYTAAIRACSILGDRKILEYIVRATRDFDYYVRIQALDALKRLDPTGEDARSRTAVLDTLNDPSENVIRSACQVIVQFRDTEAVPRLRHIMEERPEVASAARDALRLLGE